MEIYFTVLAVSVLVAIVFLCFSRAYDLNIRNFFSILVGGIAAFLIILYPSILLMYAAGDYIVITIIMFLVIASPFFGSYYGLKILGKKSFYYEERKKLFAKSRK